MGTLNFSTKIAATQTAGELQAMLAKHGADAVAIRYANKQPVGLSFTLETAAGLRHFDLPVRHAPVYQLLKRQYHDGIIRRAFATEEQAQRTAWRIVKVWLEAQLAFIEAEMVGMDEVMLPYLRVTENQTMYEAWKDSEMRALTAGQS